METEVNAEGGGREVRQMFISAVRHSAEWAEQAAGTPIQGASSIIHLLMSSQTTKQPSLPSLDQGKKTAGFLPFCGPVSKAPLSVQWLCILISPVTGWSEKLPWLSKARLVPAWQALMASTEQHVSYDFTSAVTLHALPIAPCVPTAGAVHGEHQHRPNDHTVTWNPWSIFFQGINIIYKCKKWYFCGHGEKGCDSQNSPWIALFLRSFSDSDSTIKFTSLL